MSGTNIMTIREMIDSAFGDPDENIVNLKLIQTILYVLARQLRVLERRVGVAIGPSFIRSASSISITEVKLLTSVKKKKRNIRNASSEKKKTDSSSKSTTDRSSEKSVSKSTTERTTSSGPSSSLKTSTTLSSSDKTKSSTDKSPSSKVDSDIYKKKFPSQEYHHLLETIEQQRERELRIVDQRADSREEAEKVPTPMVSLDSMEMQFEKLLIVERVSSEDGETKSGAFHDSKGLNLSIVTKDQFDNLAETVKELQEKFSSVGKALFPENTKLMQDLRRGASLTDAMAALQLSARLDAAEMTLQQMLSLITDLAIRKGIEIADIRENETEMKDILDAPSHVSGIPSHVSRKSTARKQSLKVEKKIQALPTQSAETSHTEIVEHFIEEPMSEPADEPNVKKDTINVYEMDNAMQEVYESLLKTVKNMTSKVGSTAENALKIAHKLEEKVNNATTLDVRMDDIETLVSDYAEKINTLDTGLSSQMTNYQEQLTQMQHDLEAGLESMTEAIANTGGDTTAIAELNFSFNNLQIDFDATNLKQKELRENQDMFSSDLTSLWKQIEILRGTKSDRDEVADALRDKAGIGALNGLVTQQQFDAVRGDFEKRIAASYDKFNNQEIIWQKAIDDLLRELNEKAGLEQIASLRDDINTNLEKLRSKVNAMMEIVGEPRLAATTKKLFRDTACLSCSSPAHMDIDEPNVIPPLPALPNPSRRPPIIEAENITKPKEDGDHGLCYPGRPIQHPKDPRSHYCQRYCGGSHTVVTNTSKRAPAGMIISSFRQTNSGIGVDGKTYKIDEPEPKLTPCVPCNLPNVTPAPSEKEQGFNNDTVESLDLFARASIMKTDGNSVSVTPPAAFDDD
ncbi:myosin-10-like isoform X1 [Vanessa atalanta]|uniref:myosin-10-like isoform X1 n=1 Tax=Vanessa atalanta TaxID=42275 RepID=UPI001FCDA665|nr:myosin-10-like isoform X1 [Vanessa atalanta]